MANPIAVPGTVVPSGAAVSPGGAQGPSAISANANNKATLGTDSLVLVQGTAASVAATTHAQTVSGDDPQLTNARTPTAHESSHVTGSDQIPLASASTKGLLNQVSGNTTDFIDGTNNSQNLVNAIQGTIWYAKTRNYNALNNSGFEVDQRNVGVALTNPASNTFLADRWQLSRSALTGAVNVTRAAQPFQPGNVWPGTSFLVSQNRLFFTLTTAQATLAAGDFYIVQQGVEAPRMRELESDVHSFSVMVQSSVTPLKFSIFVRDSTNSYSLVKLCNYNVTANAWQVFAFPALPIFPSAGTYGITPGTLGYNCGICLACGSSSIAPSEGVWNAGNFVGAPGMDNWLSKPITTTTFSVCFIQHEPGSYCTGPIDLPFTQAYDDALRFYQKSYDYGTALATLTANGAALVPQLTTTALYGVRFFKPMARASAAGVYNHATGAINTFQHTNGSNFTLNSLNGLGQTGWPSANTTAMPAVVAGAGAYLHWFADTGW